MKAEDHELAGWEVERATIADGAAPARCGSEAPPDQQRRRSIRDVRPLTCGPLLQPFDRAEIADEMFER